MKKTSISLIAALSFILCSCGGVEGDNSTPSKFGELIFNTLKENKPDLYSQYIYTKEDVEDILENFDGTPEEKAEFSKFKLDNRDETAAYIERAFAKMRNDAEGRGITDWSEFEFKRTTFKKLEKPGVTYAQFVAIEFASDDYTVQVEVFRFMETKRGWVIVSVPEFSFLRPNNLFGW